METNQQTSANKDYGIVLDSKSPAKQIISTSLTTVSWPRRLLSALSFRAARIAMGIRIQRAAAVQVEEIIAM
jgi:hypothetical protein